MTFLKNGGERGPQLIVLTPGKYRLNRCLWDYAGRPAKEVEAGFVVREVRLGEPAIPPELLVAARREQLAKAFVQEKQA